MPGPNQSVSPALRKRRRDAPRRLARHLRNKLQASRRWLAAAVAVAVLSLGAALALVLQPAPPPDPVLLGQGPAGVVRSASHATSTPAARRQPGRAVRPVPADCTRTTADSALGEGHASYYAESLEGRPTASGEPFRGEGLTAAHRSLPLGSRVRVTNLTTNESVVVRVNDRGPFAPDRVIDVSTRAAREIGMLQAGTAQVRLELIRS